jgi:hypothetical protein
MSPMVEKNGEHQEAGSSNNVQINVFGCYCVTRVVFTGPFIKNFPCNHTINIKQKFFFRRSKRQRNF